MILQQGLLHRQVPFCIDVCTCNNFSKAVWPEARLEQTLMVSWADRGSPGCTSLNSTTAGET